MRGERYSAGACVSGKEDGDVLSGVVRRIGGVEYVLGVLRVWLFCCWRCERSGAKRSEQSERSRATLLREEQ